VSERAVGSDSGGRVSAPSPAATGASDDSDDDDAVGGARQSVRLRTSRRMAASRHVHKHRAGRARRLPTAVSALSTLAMRDEAADSGGDACEPVTPRWPYEGCDTPDTANRPSTVSPTGSDLSL
jgi:hypothetical protein